MKAACASFGLALVASSALGQDLPWETWRDLRQLARVPAHSGSYLASSYCLDGCRYDRTSVDSGRGGQRFIRIESTPDGEQGVIFEQPGAGAVTRIWMTTGDGVSTDLPRDVRLRVYFEGGASPAIDTPLRDYFKEPPARFGDRSIPPIPFENDRLEASGGNVSYLPLPYRRGIKIALLNGANTRLWYQLNYTQVPDGTPVAPYAGKPPSYGLAWLLAKPWVDDFLAGKMRPVGRGRTVEPRLGSAGDRVDTLTASSPAHVVWRDDGAGWLLEARFAIDRSRWDDVRIACTFDGERTVDLPVAEFFTADTLDAKSPRGVLAGVDGAGAFYMNIPMPYRSSAAVELRLREGAVEPVAVRSLVRSDSTPPPADAGTFHTQRYASCPTTPATSGDTVLLAHEGSGRMIGLAAWMTGDGARTGGYYLEGDERLYVDGSVQPLWYGTGVEDLFNGGFYFDQGKFVAPLAGATLRHPGGTDDATSMYRWFLTDAPRWRHSIVFKLENGAYGTEPICLRSVAYYYASSAAAQTAVASLQLGVTSSESAAFYQRSAGAQCANQTARFGDEPPTERAAMVCRGTFPSRFALRAPTPGTAFRLRRTFDAGIAGQAAEIFVNGTKVGAWPDVQANPTRRWSQMDVDFLLPEPAGELSFEIRPRDGRTVTESAYELWADVTVGSSPSP